MTANPLPVFCTGVIMAPRHAPVKAVGARSGADMLYSRTRNSARRPRREGVKRTTPMQRRIQITLGLVFGAVLVWWLFKDTNWGAVLTALRSANWGWMAVCVGLVFLSFVVRIWRWHYIVCSDRKVSFARMFSATQIGFLANFVLPARMGEPIRAIVLSRSTGIPFSKTFAFVAIDRVTDMAGLVAVLGLTVATFHPAHAIRLPADLQNLYSGEISELLVRRAAEMVALGMMVLTGGMFLVYFQRERAVRWSDRIVGVFSRKLAKKAAGLVGHFTEGMSAMGKPAHLGRAVLVSLLLWGIFLATHWTMFKGMHLDLPWTAPFVTLSLLAVFISVPGPPGFVGPFHVAIVAGLLLVSPGIDMDVARATAILAHLLNLIPVVAVGLWCLSTEKMSLRELKRESEHVQELGADAGKQA